METKKIVLAALAGTALLAASGAQARDDHWGYGHRGHYYRHVPQRVVVLPAPYYYAPPAPVYYAPPPPVYYAPRPAIYGQIPLGHHSGISFRLPL
jgi:hypothetical protein